MQKKQIIRNAIMSILQIVVISLVLLTLYKFLLKSLGAEQLGIWSVVLATTSATQIANFGLSLSVVKFVAKYIARNEHIEVSKVIQTATISVSAIAGVLLLAGYPVAKWILRWVIPPESYLAAISILPFAFLAFWTMIISSVFLAGFDGYQRIDIRSILLMGSAVLHLFLCFVFAPAYGLIGIAYARVIQNLLVLFISWLLLRKFLPFLPIFPYRWDRSMFFKIFKYGINFQVITITSMFYDPTTKALLSKFGGLSMVGYYEMASKMINQFRSIIVSSNQVLVPAIADLKEKSPEKIESLYLTSYQLLYYLSLPLYSLIIVFLPLISEFWIGRHESIFIFFGLFLAIGWFLNTLNSPAYIVNIATGELRWNVVAHITIATLNASLGFLFGIYFDGFGVVIAWVFSLVLGSSIIYISYHVKQKVSLIELFPKDSRILTIASLAGVPSAFIINNLLDNLLDPVLLNSTICVLYLTILTIFLWLHPMRKRLTEWTVNFIFG